MGDGWTDSRGTVLHLTSVQFVFTGEARQSNRDIVLARYQHHTLTSCFVFHSNFRKLGFQEMIRLEMECVDTDAVAYQC